MKFRIFVLVFLIVFVGVLVVFVHDNLGKGKFEVKFGKFIFGLNCRLRVKVVFRGMFVNDLVAGDTSFMLIVIKVNWYGRVYVLVV